MILNLIKLRHPAVVAGVFGVAVVAAACGGDGENGSATAASDGRLRVIASLYPLEYFAERIGGDRVDVRSVVPEGGDTHEFEPSPAVVREIDGAGLFIYNGLGLEPWVDALAGGGNLPPNVIRAADDAIGREFEITDEESDHEEAGLDPHVWLDPSRAVSLATSILDGLIAADPAGTTAYRANAGRLVDDLTALDTEISAALDSCRLDAFVTSHDAFNYFADRYGIQAIGISGINPLSEPSARSLADLSDAMGALGVRFVLVSPLESDRLGATLAREVGGQTLPLHTLENLLADERSAGDTYFTVMAANLESVATALECVR